MNSAATPPLSPSSLSPSALQPWLGRVFVGLGGGAGLTLGYAAIETVRQRPELLSQLTTTGVLVFTIGVIFLVMFYRLAKSFSDGQLRGVVAQERLAEGVRKLADKDDQRAREQDILLNHVAAQNQQIIQQYTDIGNQLAAIRRERQEKP